MKFKKVTYVKFYAYFQFINVIALDKFNLNVNYIAPKTFNSIFFLYLLDIMILTNIKKFKTKNTEWFFFILPHARSENYDNRNRREVLDILYVVLHVDFALCM